MIARACGSLLALIATLVAGPVFAANTFDIGLAADGGTAHTLRSLRRRMGAC